MLSGFGLCEYEARMYFTLLAMGEAKVGLTTTKASVPQSKAYSVLDDLEEKGFVELVSSKPKIYRAKVLEEVRDITVKAMQRNIQKLEESQNRLYEILQNIAPAHKKYARLRLFTPSYRKRGEINV